MLSKASIAVRCIIIFVLTALIIDCAPHTIPPTTTHYKVQESGLIIVNSPDSTHTKLPVNVYIDETFTVYQTKLIKKGFDEWERATDKFVKFKFFGGWRSSNHSELKFDASFDASRWGYCSHDVFVMNIEADNAVVEDLEKKIAVEKKVKEMTLAGYANLSCVYKFFFIVGERIETDAMWTAITVHEMGHLLAMKHINIPNESALHEQLNVDAQCLTSIDMFEFCNIWHCEFLKMKPCVPPQNVNNH